MKDSFDGLRRLDISHNHFGPTGLTALLERHPPLLPTLWMRDNDLYDQGANEPPAGIEVHPVPQHRGNVVPIRASVSVASVSAIVTF